MKYYIGTETKKLHTKECCCVKKYAADNNYERKWVGFGSIDSAKKYCRNSLKKFKYCGKCLKQFEKAIVE